MMTKSRLSSLLIAAPMSLLFACASSDGAEPADTAPVSISNLKLAPASIPVGVVTTLSGQVDFQAPSGNVAELAADVTLPGGSTQALPRVPVQAAGGKTAGPVGVALVLGPPTAGPYVITVRLVDSRGGSSNVLSTTIEAK